MESFETFRVVGSICSTVPVSATTLYGAPVLMVATGRTYQLFKGKELAMIRGGPTFDDTVRAVAQAGKYRVVAEGPRLHAWVHHKPLWSGFHQDLTKPAVTLLLAVDDLLFCVGEDRRIVVREIKTGKVLQEILVEKNETVTSLGLLSGYTNKLLTTTQEGSLHLYNFRTGTCLWYSPRIPGHSILSLVCSPYKDIVAYGSSNGLVVVLDVGSDKTIATFEHQQGAVTALAFRADKDSMLVSGTSLGEVIVWDLENRCMDGILTRSKQVQSARDALETPHVDTVHSLITFPQPENASLLVTAGADNALMQFRFDTVDGLGILVRERRGHMGSCTAATFYNADLLLTAGSDRAIRVTHVFSDRASWELSQGRLGKKGREKQIGREAMKIPPATALASCPTRNYQWASAVSLHAASAQLCGWRMDSRRLDFKLSGIQTTSHTARAVAMSDCGNFAVVGYSSGNVAIMNIQNKSIRQLFNTRLGPNADCAHEGSVECVEVACCNTVVVTAGLDGVIHLWDLHSGDLKSSISVGQPMTKSCVHQNSSLFMVAQHYVIRVYHCNPDAGLLQEEMRTPVRELVGHTSPITAMALAPDSYRYVVSTSGDGAMLLWDLAAAACVGQYRFTSPATSVSFHPDALFLATTHAGERGTFLWSNNLRYGFVPEVVPRPEARTVEELPWLHFPTSHGATEVDAGAAEEQQEIDEEAEASRAEAVLFNASNDIALMQRKQQQDQRAALDSIHTEGLQLAGVPRSTWLNLTLLDQIKEKNQPLLPPKKKDVPFFLPTTQELRPTFLLIASGGRPADGVTAGRRQMEAADLLAPTPVQRMLLAEEHDALMTYFLEQRTAQAIDLELKRAVDYVQGVVYTQVELDRMKGCLRGLLLFVKTWLVRGENVDLVQGILADILRSHGPLMTRFGQELVEEMTAVAEVQNRLRYSLDHLVSYPGCLAGTFSGSVF